MSSSISASGRAPRAGSAHEGSAEPTETGTNIHGDVTEERQALDLMTLYLAQFRRGYAYTSVYLLRDRTDEDGNQAFGFFKPDYTPRKAALYLRTLTTILADRPASGTPGRLDYTIDRQPETVHDLLLQRSDGRFQLVIWGERLAGEDTVTVRFGVTQPVVEIYDPTAGIEPVKVLANVQALELALSNHPLIVTISSHAP